MVLVLVAAASGDGDTESPACSNVDLGDGRYPEQIGVVRGMTGSIYTFKSVVNTGRDVRQVLHLSLASTRF